jgi:hypothetical protein
MKRSRLYLFSFIAAALFGAVSDSSATIRRVPLQYASIQLAIDMSAATDTILVSRGRYYENINFRGKAITVASHYIIDHDTTHIDSTIIDGSRPANPDSGSTVFFISGEDTSSVLCGLTITGGTGSINPVKYRVGGGVWVLGSSGARICRNRIIFNTVTHQDVAIGAGVLAGSPYEAGGWLILEDNEISHNTVTATNSIGATGVFCGMNARIERNRIEGNLGFTGTSGSAGGGMYCWTEAPGIKDLVVRGNTISGNKSTSTGLDQYGHSGLGGGFAISGFRAIFEGNVITDNELEGPGKLYGGGVLLDFNSDLLQFRNNWISGNRLIGSGEHMGGGLCIWSCSPSVYNNIIADNEGKMGGGVFVGGTGNPLSRPQMVNNTICGNSAPFGSGLYSAGSYPVVVNSILWDDSPDIYQSGGVVTVEYSDVRGGWTGSGNINVKPMFLDTTYRLSDSSLCIGAGIDSTQIGGSWYHAPSFCFYGSPRPDPSGSHPDMGACESPQPIVGVAEDEAGLPSEFALGQNYPNPFNPATVITYQLPAASDVRLSVYDVLGREVAVLVSERRGAGVHKVGFDASGLSSGVYLYSLRAGDFMQTRRLIFLK